MKYLYCSLIALALAVPGFPISGGEQGEQVKLPRVIIVQTQVDPQGKTEKEPKFIFVDTKEKVVDQTTAQRTLDLVKGKEMQKLEDQNQQKPQQVQQLFSIADMIAGTPLEGETSWAVNRWRFFHNYPGYGFYGYGYQPYYGYGHHPYYVQPNYGFHFRGHFYPYVNYGYNYGYGPYNYYYYYNPYYHW